MTGNRGYTTSRARLRRREAEIGLEVMRGDCGIPSTLIVDVRD
jgi:hypothetical protein